MQSFYDVSHTDWHYNYVTSLYLAGITYGDSNGLFHPNNHISREEATVMLIRLLEKSDAKPVYVTEKILFNDAPDISSWAISSIEKATSLGLIKGNDNNNFMPENDLTRAEACVLTERLAALIKGK